MAAEACHAAGRMGALHASMAIAEGVTSRGSVAPHPRQAATDIKDAIAEALQALLDEKLPKMIIEAQAKQSNSVFTA
jgi:hypothetical protein